MGRHGEILGDHREQFDDLGFDGLQLTLESLPMLGHSRKIPQSAAVQAWGPPSDAGVGGAAESPVYLVFTFCITLVHSQRAARLASGPDRGVWPHGATGADMRAFRIKRVTTAGIAL